MTQYEITTPPAPALGRTPTRQARDGWICAVGAAVMGVGAGVTAMLPSDVPSSRMSYPYEAGTFVVTELVWTLSHVLTLFGAIALARSGVAAVTRAGRIAVRVALAGMALLVPAELSLTLVARADVDDPLPMAISAVFGIAVVLAGAGFTVAGVTVLRHGTWSGWGRWTPLLVGVFVLAVSIPVQALLPDLFLWPIAGWGVCLLLLGLALTGRKPS